MNDDKALLAQEVRNSFSAYDKDQSEFLDRRELRQFLKDFFGSYHVHIPVTDEYVDGVFRSIDRNHDNKLQPEELIAFSEVFIGKLVALFIEAANAADSGASVPLEEEQKE